MTKIANDELQKVKQNREQVIQSSQNLSDLVLQQTMLENLIAESKKTFLQSVSNESDYLQSLNEKYGEGLLDIETGEIKTT